MTDQQMCIQFFEKAGIAYREESVDDEHLRQVMGVPDELASWIEALGGALLFGEEGEYLGFVEYDASEMEESTEEE